MISRRTFLQVGGAGISLSGIARGLFARENREENKLINMTKDVRPLEPEDYLFRRQQAVQIMENLGLDAFFMEGGPSLQYFTAVNWGRSERTFGVILFRKEKMAWICSRFELERARELIPAGQEIRTWEEHESPFALIRDTVQGMGLRTARLGIEPTVRHFILHGLSREAPSVELVDGAPVSQECRARKSSKELAFMELANRITKLAYREAFKGLRDGMEPRDLAALVSSSHREMGVQGGGWPQFGPNTAFPHGSRVLQILKPGSVVMVDGGCSVEGYRSDVTRTIVFGPASDKQKRIADIVIRAQREAFKAVRPGITCGEIDRTARKVIDDAGFGPGYARFLHRLGHGIGMEGHEYPYLVKDNPLKLEPGMTFSNEPGIYIYGEFGIRTEDCFVVTPDGARCFGGMPAESIDRPFADA